MKITIDFHFPGIGVDSTLADEIIAATFSPSDIRRFQNETGATAVVVADVVEDGA